MSVPEYVKQVGANEFSQIQNFTDKFRAKNSVEQLHQVCLSQCDVCIEFYKGILSLTANDLNLPAQAICRNVFEVVIVTTYLVKHPELLNDFLDFGRLVRYRALRSVKLFQSDHYKQKFDAHVAATKADFETLEKRFGSKWLKKSIEDLTKDAGEAVDPSTPDKKIGTTSTTAIIAALLALRMGIRSLSKYGTKTKSTQSV